MKKKNTWLMDYKRDDQSQNGEDGILEKIFEVLGISKGWCVELGAWDGKKYSNTYSLITNKTWSGVLIEGDPSRFKDLLETYQSRKDIHCVQQFVGFEKHNDLDSVFKNTPLPVNFDLLSIDIDGNDIHLWETLTHYQPKVVIIEYNFTIPNSIAFVQPRDMSLNQGNSLLANVQLGLKKGYHLIATTKTNAIFVQEQYFPLFEIEDNSIEALRGKSPDESQIFQLYDGTLVLEGNKKLLWSGVPIRQEKLQIFPQSIRYYRTTNPFKKFLRSIWRFLYTRKVY